VSALGVSLGHSALGAAESWTGPFGCHIQLSSGQGNAGHIQFNENEVVGGKEAEHYPICKMTAEMLRDERAKECDFCPNALFKASAIAGEKEGTEYTCQQAQEHAVEEGNCQDTASFFSAKCCDASDQAMLCLAENPAAECAKWVQHHSCTTKWEDACPGVGAPMGQPGDTQLMVMCPDQCAPTVTTTTLTEETTTLTAQPEAGTTKELDVDADGAGRIGLPTTCSIVATITTYLLATFGH